MLLERIILSDVPFVYDCLRSLRGDAKYDEIELSKFLEENRLFNSDHFSILVARENGIRVGMLTYNRFLMPRYLGFGVEVEELVVSEAFRGRGVATRMLRKLIETLSTDLNLRRILVKTDDLASAGRVYEKLFALSELRVFTNPVNRI